MQSKFCAHCFAFASVLFFGNGIVGGAQAALTVSTSATSNVTCSNKHVCTATAADAVLNVSDLTNMLAGSDVKLVPGNLAMDIDIAASVSWASASRLTLDAYHSITVEQPVAVTGTGAMTFSTNDGGSGGLLTFGSQGYVNFWDLGSSLIVNRKSFALVNDIASLESGIAANPKGNFALAKSYDATPDGTYSQAPVVTVFKGVFGGLGNTISNLTIIAKHQHYLGLFAKLDPSGAIGNLRLTAVTLKGKASYIGTLVAYDRGLLFDDFVAGSILEKSSSNSDVGGMVGFVSDGPVIIDAQANVSVKVNGGGNIGGLVGDANVATISNSFSTGSITVAGGGNLGGLVGAANDGSIDSSYSTGIMNGGNLARMGGLVGQTDYESISNSHATGSVTVTYASTDGGLVGYNRNTAISGSYATGNVQSTGDVVGSNGQDLGGLVGACDGGSISDSYATGAVIAPNSVYTNAVISAGGLVGDAAGIGITRSFATGNVSAGTGLVALGGLVGEEGGPISQSWASGSVTAGGGGAGSPVGGLAGDASSVTDSYATGAVSAGTCGNDTCSAGGLVGSAGRDQLSQVYSTGSVSGVSTFIGGSIGYDYSSNGSAAAAYWDLDTSGVSNPSQGAGNIPNDPGLIGLTDTQLKSGLPSGFDPQIWGQSASINNGYPYLLAVPPGGHAAHHGSASVWQPLLHDPSFKHPSQRAAFGKNGEH